MVKDTEDSVPSRAVALEHLLWVEAETDDEAVEKARRELADADYDDLLDFDMGVVDVEEF